MNLRATPLVATVLALVTISLPLFGLGLAPGPALPIYLVNATGQIMCLALLALAVDLMWGSAGILSLGHGLFFALGGYLCAMHLLRTAYAETGVLPDFLQFMGQTAFPGWWAPFDSSLFTMAAIIVAPTIVAGIFGYVSFRSRVNGVYLSIITQALTYTAMLLMFRNNSGFGGNNGMTGFHSFAGLDIGKLPSAVLLASLSTGVLLVCFVSGRLLLATRYGRLLAAIRDDEPRLRFLGYESIWLKLSAWCLSAVVAAIAGALYVPQVGIINPSLLDPSLSLEIAVWVAVGGRGGLVGAILGAVLVNLLKFWLAGAAPAAWPFVLGGFVLVIALYLPNGLLDALKWKRARRLSALPGLFGAEGRS